MNSNNNRPVIKVLGIGSPGVRIAGRLLSEGFDRTRVFGVDSCKEEVDHHIGPDSSNGLVIGWSVNHGLGAAGNVQRGRKAAKVDKEKIKAVIQDADVVILTAGLGGGIGTGATQFVAEMCSQMCKPTVCIVTLPFPIEGERRTSQAIKGLNKLERFADMVIPIKLDLIEEPEIVPLWEQVKLYDGIVCERIKDLEQRIRRRWEEKQNVNRWKLLLESEDD